MSPGSQLLLVVTVFASQILVCSFLSALRFARAARVMHENYPPEEYPRLYPIPAAQMRRQAAFRNAIRIAIGLAAMAVLVSSLVREVPAARIAQYMIWMALAQLVPSLMALPEHIGMQKARRDMPAPRMRSADLRSWSAGEFLSPVEIALGVLVSGCALAFTLYLFFQDQTQTRPGILLSLIANGLLLLRMLYVLFGPTTLPRPDPYMTDDDLYRARRFRMQMLFRGAAAMGVYFSFVLAWTSGLLEINGIYIATGVSMLVQLLSMFLTHRMLRTITDRDATPYRATAG